jgi:hypothetical protein
VVSRDRGGEYAAEAARRAVPDGVQVADRFHLLKNLRDVILRVFKQSTLKSWSWFRLRACISKDWRTSPPGPRKASKARAREQAHNKLFHSIHALSQRRGYEERSGGQRARDTPSHTVEKYLAFKVVPPQRRHFTKKLSAAIAP